MYVKHKLSVKTKIFTNSFIIVAILLLMSVVIGICCFNWSNTANAATCKSENSGTTTFNFEEIGKTQGWEPGKVLSDTYTVEASDPDPDIKEKQTLTIVGDSSMSFDSHNGQNAIKYGRDTQKNGGYMKLNRINDEYEITSMTIVAATEKGLSSDVACVVANQPYYRSDMEWWGFYFCYNKFDTYIYRPDYRYVPKGHEFYINSYQVTKFDNPLYIQSIIVNYHKPEPQCHVSGKVVDTQNQPIENVIISHHDPSSQTNIQAKTNAEGKWDMTVNAHDNTSFLFTKKGMYEAAIKADLAGKSEYAFEKDYVMPKSVSTYFNCDVNEHLFFYIEGYINDEYRGYSVPLNITKNYADTATITMNNDQCLVYQYTDKNSGTKHKEMIYPVAVPGYDLDYIKYSNATIKDKKIEPGDTITLNATSTDEQYSFVPVYKEVDASHKLSIYYTDDQSKEIAPKYEADYAFGQKFFVESPIIKGYKLIDPSQNMIKGQMLDQDLNIYVTYKQYEETHVLTINYVDEQNNPVAPSFKATYYEHEKFSVTSPDVDHYGIKNPKEQYNISGEMQNSDITIDVVYVKAKNFVISSNYGGNGFMCERYIDQEKTDSKTVDVLNCPINVSSTFTIDKNGVITFKYSNTANTNYRLIVSPLAKDGFNFDNYTDADGNVYEIDKEYSVTDADDDFTMKANFLNKVHPTPDPKPLPANDGTSGQNLAQTGDFMTFIIAVLSLITLISALLVCLRKKFS